MSLDVCVQSSTKCSVHILRVAQCAFSSVVRQMPGYNSPKRGTARTLPNFLYCHVYCLCVNVYCTAATGGRAVA